MYISKTISVRQGGDVLRFNSFSDDWQYPWLKAAISSSAGRLFLVVQNNHLILISSSDIDRSIITNLTG
jgi:hypothetical protein